MADLNDFFARKDKKKSKNMKFTTLNNIDQKLKELDLRREKARRHSSDDEWNGFEERKVDYTGLKIQNCTLQEDDAGTESERENEEPSCTWSEITQSLGSTEVKESSIEKETQIWKTIEPSAAVQQEKPAPTARAYVPPHLRNKPIATTERHNKSKGLQCDNIENMFPSLPTPGSANIWENKTKIQEYNCPTKNPLKLENKFGTLNNRSD